MPGKPSDIPVGTQFSPDLLDFRQFLAAAVARSGDKDAMMDAIWARQVRAKRPKKAPTRRQRSLPLEAAVQYGLLRAKTYEVTDLARRLARLDEPELGDEFAKHILLRLGGIRVVEAAQQMKMDGLKVTGDSLARYLSDQGFTVVEHNTAINSLRMWLARAGVFRGKGWDVDPVRKQDLLGMDDDTIASLVGLTEEQKSFVIALCRINPPDRHPAAEVRNLAESILGRTIARASLPKFILEPLKEAGLIEYETKGTSGGKTSQLWTATRFAADVLAPFVEDATRSLDAALTAYYKRAPAEIYGDLSSKSTDVKGRALEAFAVYIMRLMGLRFVAWRKRARDTTARAEIDVIMTGMTGGLPSRWQVQCKNTPTSSVSLEDVAKEVGLTPVTKATHVMVLANCKFTDDAVGFTHEVMRHSPLTIFLLDITDFERIKASPGDLPVILRAKSDEIVKLQRGTSLWH